MATQILTQLRDLKLDGMAQALQAQLEQVGTYDPSRPFEEVRLDLSRVDYWLGVGAQPARSVLHGQASFSIDRGEWIARPAVELRALRSDDGLQ